jgi:hypothetical protein
VCRQGVGDLAFVIYRVTFPHWNMATAAGLVRRTFDHFDEHAWAGRKTRAVNQQTKLAYADIERMHIVRKAQFGSRWTLPPTWSQHTEQLAEVILRFLEARVFLRDHTGTNEERLQRVQEKSLAQIPVMEKTLKALLARYSEQAARNYPPKVLAKLQTQIQNLDSQICLQRRGIAGVVTAVAYQHFRLMHTSVQIAESVGVKPPMVRVWAHRMVLLGREIFEGVQRPAKRPLQRHRSPGALKFIAMSPNTLRVTIVGQPKYNKLDFYEMRKAGCTMTEICRVTGASKTYVWRTLKKAGL